VLLIRRLGAAVLALSALIVWFVMAPEESSDRSGDISRALASYEINDARTEGAPQQQVVNGWVAKDLLTVIAEQQNDAVTDSRLTALAGLGVLGLALHIATSSRPAGPAAPLTTAGPIDPPLPG
jgi:hypothetical protein